MTKTCLKIGSGLFAIAVAVTAAHAQSSADTQAASTTQAASSPAPDDVNEIIVTAQFRHETLQETPLAITAVNAAMIQEKGLDQITDITNSAPNVVMKPSGSVYGPAATIFIRGVGQTDSSFASDPGVGIYVDDVYRGITFGSLLDLLDLSRVEILRGPQGTLAGKNSIGGAVKLYSVKPDGNGGGYVEATTGSYNRLDLRGAADFTVVPDRLFVRVSGVTRHRDGYLTRYDFNCTHPGGPTTPSAGASSGDCKIGAEGGKNYTAGRIAARWIASDNIEINLAADRLVDDSEPAATKLLSLNADPASTPGAPDRSVFVTCPHCYSNYSTYTTPAFTDPANYLGRPGAGTHPETNLPTTNRIRAWDFAGTIDIKLPNSMSIKAITGYQYTNGLYTTDNDGTPYGISNGVFGMKYKQFTQEIRLNGDIGRSIEYTVGGYYFNGKGYTTGQNFIYPGLPRETINSVDDYIPTVSKSGFAHAVWHITDKIDLTGGVRYTDDRKSYTFHRGNIFIPGIPTYTNAAAIDGLKSVYSGDHWDYRVNLSYQPTQNLMFYSQFSTGYRGGGVNSRPFVIEQAVPYGPETLDAYEIGMKSQFFDRRLTLNVAAFINNYNAMIFSNNAPTVVNGVVVSPVNATPINAGDGRFKGIELEMNARPVDGLSFDFNASYLDFKLVRIGATGAVLAGITLDDIAPYVTKWKVAAGAQYEAEIGDWGTLTPRVDMAYQSSFYTNINNSPNVLTPGYTVFNARLSWKSESKDWELALAVTNLFDKFYYQNKFFGPAISAVTGQPAPPREWSLTLRRKF